ncbi:sugar phosphate isomerase/epimerase family protein [Marinilabilia sp.]
MKRRDFIKQTGLSLAGLNVLSGFTAVQLDKRVGQDSNIPLGVCNHSLRGLHFNVRQLLQYALEQKLDSILVNTLNPFERLDNEYLNLLSQLALQDSISIYVGVGSISKHSTQFRAKHGNPQELLLEGIRVASHLKSPIVGCRIGSYKDRFIDGGIEAHIEAVIKVMQSVRSQALDARIKFAFENHMGDLRSDELNTLIVETGKDICGALFDPANALWALEDPMQALDNLGKKIICTSVRDIAVWETKDGAAFTGMAIGEGMLDYPKFARQMHQNCPHVPLQVETISNQRVNLPYLTPEFRKGFPKLTEGELHDFISMVRKGAPVNFIQAPDGLAKKEFDIKLQKMELQKSFFFLREKCKVGLKEQ